MTWDLPVDVEINGQKHKIRNKCDYRVVLDVFGALNDKDLTDQEKIECALFIFYGNDELKTPDKVMKVLGCDIQLAVDEMMRIISGGTREERPQGEQKPQLMDWEHDFPQLAPPISRVLGYSVRDAKNYTHFWDFLGAYMEIGECVFAQIVSIRNKKLKGKKLEKYEREFYEENKRMVDLPNRLSSEEAEWLNSDW